MAEWLSSQGEIPLCGKCGGNKIMYFVYVLKSLKQKRYYIGHTKDLAKRLKEHNAGKTKSTKGYVPWQLVYSEKYETKSESYIREQEIKKYKGCIKFKKLINSERWQSG